MARLNGARLLMLEKGEDKVVREIPVRTSQVQIGSNPTKNTIRLNSAGVEEIHCKIFVKNDKVFIANFSAKNPISVDKSVVPKRTALTDGSILEICGTRFRWKFTDSKLPRSEKAKKTEQTPTSSKFGNRRRTTLVRKKQAAAAVATTAGGSGKKPAAKRTVQQKTPTFTLPKNHKQLLKNIRKRFTVHNIMTRQNSEDGADEEDMECEDADNLVEHPESPTLATPQKPSSTTSSAANTPFFTPEPEKENSIPVSKTPKTPMLQLENSAMMILSYTPAIGSRSKANIQKTPISAAKSAQRLNYLTPKNENISVSGTPQKSKAGNSMYLIDLTTPNSGHSSFVCSPMLDTTASSVGTPKVGLIDLTTPSPKMVKTPAPALKSTQQKTLLKSALKNASRTPLRTGLRTATGTPATPKAVPKISLNETPTKSAASTRSNKTPASGSTRGGSIRSKLETPISSKKHPDSVRKEAATPTATVAQPELNESKDVPIMTTDELFDTLVGRQSVVKTYERKSMSPKKTPLPLVLAEDTSDMPKTDIDLWVESVVAAVTSPEPVNMDSIIRKPNQTTQVRSSQYSDITPHESFAESAAVASTSEVIDPLPENVAVDASSPDELDNLTDKPTIPNSNRRSETPLASKIARSLGNKRQTIGNFFTNIFGKLTVSPVTRISIADDSANQCGEEEEPTQGEDSDGSEEVYHDSETSHAADVPPEHPADKSIASSPKLRHSLRDTRKFIGNAWTSLNTSRPQLDNTADIDESLLLSDTYNETQPDADDSASDEVYDLTDLGSRPATAQPPKSAAKTPTQRRSVQSAGASFDISPLATPLESTPNKSVSQELVRDETGSFVISPDATTMATSPSTPVTRRSQQNVTPTTSSTPSRRSSKRQTKIAAESADVSVSELNGSTVNSLESAEAHACGIAPQDPSCSRNTTMPLEQTVRTPNKATNDQINEVEEVSQVGIFETVSETLDQTIPTEGETDKIDRTNSEEEPISGDIPANSTSLMHLDTSEMEPLEVTDGHESESEIGLPETPTTNDLVGIKRATRNSIATIHVVTPKTTTATSAKVPLSESKLPLRRLRKPTAETPSKTPEKTDHEPVPKEDSFSKIDNEDQVDQTATESESAAEQSGECDKLSTFCVDQVEVDNTKIEESECDEILALEESQKIMDPGVESVGKTAGQKLADSIANLEQTAVNESLNSNATARRNTRKSLATMTATPKIAVESSKVPMSESKLPLRSLKVTVSARLDQTVEESPIEQVSALVDATAVEPKEDPVAVESSDELLESSVVENVTPNESNQSEKRTPAPTVPGSPARSSRSSARLTPQKASSSTPKSTPSGTTPLLKRVLQKVVKASATKNASAPSPKSDLNESEADASLQLDQLYQTPTLRVTRGKASNTSTPNVADASLKLDELYKTPARATRGNAATPASAATSKDAVKSGNEDELPVSSNHHTDNPVQSTTPQKDLDSLVVTSSSSENKLESSAVDKSLNLQELYKTLAKILPIKLAEVVKTHEQSVLLMAEVDMSLNLQQLYQTPVRAAKANLQESAAKNAETSEESNDAIESEPAFGTGLGKVDLDEATEPQKIVDTSLNLQELYKTPARSLRENSQQSTVKNTETPNESVIQADGSLNLQELYKTPARPTRHSSTFKSTPNVIVDIDVSKADEAVEPQPNSDMSLNLQELYKTPARSLRENSQLSTVKNTETPSDSVVQADVSLNLQELYKTPARPTRHSSTVKSTPNAIVDVDEAVEPQPNSDMSLNLQKLYKTPARSLRENSQLSTVKNTETPSDSVVQADVSLNLQELYKTPARPTRQSSVVKSTPQPAVDADISKVKVDEPVEPPPNENVTPNLRKLNNTPAKELRANVDQVAVKNAATPKEGAFEADLSLNLQQLYKTPARSTRHSSAVKNTQQSAVKPGTSMVEEEPQPTAKMSLDLHELYKTPTRTLRGVSQLNHAAGPAKVNSPAIEAVQIEPEADLSLNLEQLYKTPARTLRGAAAQLAAVKPVKVSEVTPQKGLEKSALDVTPTAELSKVERTPIAKVSQPEVDMTLNLEQMYQTPARQSFAAGGSTKIDKADPDMSLNLGQLYKTPARTLRGVTQLASVQTSTPATESKKEADVSLNLQEMYKTPLRTLRGSDTQQSGTPNQESANMSLNLQDLYKTPAQTRKVSDTNVQGTVDDSNMNVESLFKTPAHTTRAKLPRSSAKVTPQTVASPLLTSRSASKAAVTASVQEQPSISMVESELASSVVGESMDMGSESDGLVTGRMISSSTPFNPRIRKSTLVAAVGMMSPLNSSGDTTSASEMHTEAIGITTIDRSVTDSTTVDQMQTMAGVYVEAQSRLLYDESGIETIQGDPLQVSNAVEEDITCAVEVEATQLNETTQRTVAESLLEQNETLIEATISEQAPIDASKSSEQSTVLTTTANYEDKESVQNTLPEAKVSTPARSLRRTSQSPATKVDKASETSGNRSAMESSILLNVVEPDVDSSLSAEPTGTANISSAIVEPVAVTKSPAASPKDPSTASTDVDTLACEGPTRSPSVGTASRQPTPSNASKHRVSVTDNVSINEQELVTVSTLSDTPVVSSIVEEKSTDQVPDVSIADDPVIPSLMTEKMDDESIPVQSVVNLSAVHVSSDAMSDSETTMKESNAAATYLNSLGVDPVLLQQIHDRVDTLEREFAEMNDITQSSSTFLERSDEQSLDLQESELEAKLQDKTPKPMKRRLYTKTAPDDSTPERRESTGTQRVSSFYTESDSDRKPADTSSEIEEPKKVLPSRASRRKITTLSEEALAGASPELKFVKPKPPKIAVTEDHPPQVDSSINTSEAEQSDQETSLGRRKVAFNEHIQVKEINSPAFIGEIIKKTTLRGRGRNYKQVVTITIDQHAGQSIKPATKRAKIVDPDEVAAPQEGTNTSENVPDRAETVKPDRVPAAETEVNDPVVEARSKKSQEYVDKPTTKRSRAKKAPATKRAVSRTKVPIESAAEDEAHPEEGTSLTEVTDYAPDKVEAVESERRQVEAVVKDGINPTDLVEEEPPKESEEIVEAPVDEVAAKRTKKAPATKRVGSRKKVPLESAVEEEVDADPSVQTSEDIVEASADEPAAMRSRAKKAPATKRAVSRTKVENKEEDNEDKIEEPETPPVEPSAKRPRRGANNAVKTTVVEEEKSEAEQKVEEPISKRVRHAHESSTEPSVDTTVEDQTNKAEKTGNAQTIATTKATSRSRSGKKQAVGKSDAVPAASEDNLAQPQPTEPVSKPNEVKSRSRRGGKKKDSPTEEVVPSDSVDDKPAEVAVAEEVKKPVETEVDNTTIKVQKTPLTEEETHVTAEKPSKAKAQPRSRRGARGKTAPAEEVVVVENSAVDVQAAKSDEEDSNFASHSTAAVRKMARRGRGAVQNDTVESSELMESYAPLVSTSHDIEPSAAAEDGKSGAKRSRRGAVKDEAIPAEAVEQVNEPASKRSRRTPKPKVTDEAHDETDDQSAVVSKPTSRSRRGQKQNSNVVVESESSTAAVEKPATEGNMQTQDKQQEETKEGEKSDIEEKPTSRGRVTRKKPAEEQSSSRMPSPTLPPPTVDEQPAKRVGRQAAKRAPKKPSNLDPVPVEMSMNESHMVKTMLPASHTSTPLIKTALTDTAEIPSGTRGRRAAANPVIAALIEESTPRTRTRRGASATPEVQIETPSTPSKRGRGRGAAAKAKVIEEESQSTVTEAPQTSTAVDESEPSTSTVRSRGKKTAKLGKAVIEEVEPSVEAEPATKRTRKVPAKLRDDADDGQKTQPSRGRRRAKAKTEESNAVTDEEEASSVGPSEEKEPKRKPRAAAAKGTAKKKATDLIEASVPEEKEADEEEEAPKSPPPKRTRKGAR